MDARLAGVTPQWPTVPVADPWDLWWVAFRSALPADVLPVVVPVSGGCEPCRHAVDGLLRRAPPRFPPPTVAALPCGCLRRWAVRFRRPVPRPAWPPLRLTLVLVKPGSPADAVRELLPATFRVVETARRALSPADTRRLYPDAYGAEFVARRDAYLTSGLADVLVVVTPGGSGPPTAAVKQRIRTALGDDAVRNHVHMPDSPGEALCDIGHLAGIDTLAALYRRFDRDHAAGRLARYRALLGARPAHPHRDRRERW
jgi:hypothetical protein